VQCLILGDEIGLPILLDICSRIKMKIAGYIFSKDREMPKSLINQVSSLNSFCSPNDVKTIEFLKGNKIDLVLVHSYNVILKEEILNVPRVKFVNIHGGKLPEYRGANVLNWAIINGDEEIGVSLHEMITNVDAGPIIGEWSIKVEMEDTANSLLKKMGSSISKNSPLLINRYLNGEILPTPQSHVNATLWPRRFPKDGVFDWSWTNTQIFNLIRALVKPWPGARYINNQGETVVIDKFMTFEEIAALRDKVMQSEA
jgi:methionyl-tRNA formyltransferase